jgi:hypothetical protein
MFRRQQLVHGPDRIGWQHKARVTEMLADRALWSALLMLTDDLVRRGIDLKRTVARYFAAYLHSERAAFSILPVHALS